MKKKELKSKMIVKLRNGDFYLVVDDVLVKENCFILLSTYDDFLLSGDGECYDVVEVYEIINTYYSFTNDLGMGCLKFKELGKNDTLKLLWCRTFSYDGVELTDGQNVWIVSNIGGISIIYNYDSSCKGDYKYFSSEKAARLYLSVFNNISVSYNDYVRMTEKNFKEHCENLIREEFDKRIKNY
jgi:hypothetical protein